MENPLWVIHVQLQNFLLGEGVGGERNRHIRDIIPCNSLADAVNSEANAVNLPCTRSHSKASKLDAVLVKQCFCKI